MDILCYSEFRFGGIKSLFNILEVNNYIIISNYRSTDWEYETSYMIDLYNFDESVGYDFKYSSTIDLINNIKKSKFNLSEESWIEINKMIDLFKNPIPVNTIHTTYRPHKVPIIYKRRNI